jgi:hypothetical protein
MKEPTAMSSDLTATAPRLGRRRRESKPETIDIGSDELVRGDILAATLGVSERTMKRAGGPHVLVGGVIYRPRREYGEFIAAGIEGRKRTQAHHRSRR